MSKHTPGPWWIAPPIFDGDVIYARPQVKGRRNEVIAMGIWNKADARLIADAPLMEKLLRKAADELYAIGCGKDPADGLEMSEHIAEFLMALDGEEPTDD